MRGFELPSWHDLRLRDRPPPKPTDDFAFQGRGWHHEAAARVEEDHREFQVFPALSIAERALLRAQGGAGGGVAFSAIPSSPLTRIDTPLFCVLLLRRLHLLLSPSSRFCRCGRPLDPCGHHRAACAQAGVLGRRGYAVESAAARICREFGARVTTNIFVRDLDLGAPIADARRLGVVADDLPLQGGQQFAINTTLFDVEVQRRTETTDGRLRRGCAGGCEASEGEDLSRVGGPTQPCNVGGPCWRGRRKVETITFLSKLAKARLLRRRAQQVWRIRWCAVLSCAVARAFAASLLGLRPVGSDGSTPFSHEVLTSWRHLGLEGAT